MQWWSTNSLLSTVTLNSREWCDFMHGHNYVCTSECIKIGFIKLVLHLEYSSDVTLYWRALHSQVPELNTRLWTFHSRANTQDQVLHSRANTQCESKEKMTNNYVRTHTYVHIYSVALNSITSTEIHSWQAVKPVI